MFQRIWHAALFALKEYIIFNESSSKSLYRYIRKNEKHNEKLRH